MPLRQFIIVGAIALTITTLGLIMGAVGPPTQKEKETFAYDCPGGLHFWNSTVCHGVQPAHGQLYLLEFPEFSSLNQNFGVVMQPLRIPPVPDTPIDVPLNVHLSIAGRDDNASLWLILENRVVPFEAMCEPGQEECAGAWILIESVVQYKNYRLGVSFNVTENVAWMGDVKFVMVVGNTHFTNMEIAVRLVFFFACIAVNVLWLMRLRRERFDQWSWEQRSLSILLLCSLFLNNPFLAIRYLWNGWFFYFLDALLEASWMSIVMMYWLFMIDKIRLDELRMEFSKVHIPKLAAVFLYTVLVIIFFTWVSVDQENYPLVGSSGSVGLTVMYYLVVFSFLLLVIWLVILAAMTLPVINAKPHMMTRYLFVTLPTLFVLLSILIGMITGTYGPQGRESTEFVYYATMWNVYVWTLAYGYWPINERFGGRNAVESDAESNVIRFEKKEPTAETSLLGQKK